MTDQCPNVEVPQIWPELGSQDEHRRRRQDLRPKLGRPGRLGTSELGEAIKHGAGGARAPSMPELRGAISSAMNARRPPPPDRGSGART